MGEDARPHFEKLWMYLSGPGQKDANIAIANCPDDYSKCSLVVSDGRHRGETQGFVRLLMSAEEVDRIIEALQKTRAEMETDVLREKK